MGRRRENTHKDLMKEAGFLAKLRHPAPATRRRAPFPRPATHECGRGVPSRLESLRGMP